MNQSSPDIVEVFTHEDAWDELVNKDDRTSPEEYPDMCLITFEELRDYILRASQPATPTATGGDWISIEREKPPPVTRMRSKICTVCGVKHTSPPKPQDRPDLQPKEI
jgi:hypothetical protein